MCLLIVLTSTAQKKAITLEALWSGAFRTERLDELHSMNNGTQYAVFEFDRAERSTNVVIYDYKTLKKVKTLVASAALPKLNYL